jgi:hypothetical protein
LTLLAVALATGCSRVVRKTVSPHAVSALDDRSPFLKVHFADGRLYLLQQWSVDERARTVSGTGSLYDANREPIDNGTFTIGIDSVAIFETNVRQTSGAIAPLVIMTGVSVSITIMCATNPKACFGSCPTFYVDAGDDDGCVESLRAEGFSSSIAPWLEASDVDALRITRPGGARMTLRMTNEALETHVVRRADLLACPVGDDAAVFKDVDGAFHVARSLAAPIACVAPEGDATARVHAFDGYERVSAADSTDLNTREMIDLTFPPLTGHVRGVVIGARQTLLTTYLLYQTLADMGTEVGAWLAAGSSLPPNPLLLDALGGIDVLVPDGEGWRVAGTVGEHGPIASDCWVVPLPSPEDEAGPARVRLRMTRGNWRLDYVALAALDGTVTPVRVAPAQVTRKGESDDDALAALWDDNRVVTTYPGDELVLGYELPASQRRYQLFLESRGYYLEWIRDEWLAEEDRGHAMEMMFCTEAALVRLAPEFKKVEADMEDAFWGSRYAKP